MPRYTVPLIAFLENAEENVDFARPMSVLDGSSPAGLRLHRACRRPLRLYCKWTLLEVMHVNRAGKSVAAPGQDIWAAVSVPSWADEPEAKKQKTEPEEWGSAFGQSGL